MALEQIIRQDVPAVKAETINPLDIKRIVTSRGGRRSALIAIFGDIQAKYRYLPEDALRIVAKEIGIPLVEVYATATFYHSFSLKPKGKHIVQCCLGTACHVRGGAGIAEELEQKLGIARGETTQDGEFSLETVNCLGACALGPVVVIDGRYFSKVKKSQISQILHEAVSAADGPDPDKNGQLLAVKANCPYCGRSLMDDSVAVDGLSGIHLDFRVNGFSGSMSFSSLYGSDSLKTDSDISPGTVTDLLCPHCRTGLNASRECSICGASMVTLDLRGGGELHFCSRHGCSGRMLDRDGTAQRN